MVVKMQPKIWMSPPQGKARKLIYDLVSSTKFEWLILTVISLNTIVLCIKWPGMSPLVEQITDTLNSIFLIIFVIEALIKIVAFGKRYFKDSWNKFDFFIVVLSTIFYIIQRT